MSRLVNVLHCDTLDVPLFEEAISIKCAEEYDRYLSLVMRKPAFAYAKTKTQISCAVTAQVISAFVFAIRLVQSLYSLNPKFQTSSHLLWLCSPVCVGPGRKPRKPVFSQRGSFNLQNDLQPSLYKLVGPLKVAVAKRIKEFNTHSGARHSTG